MWDVDWVRIDDPAATARSTYLQGADQGGARFSRLEGAWWGDRTGFFLTTNGGVAGEGQVFEYGPQAETLKLIYDSPSGEVVDNPDNITVTPRGGLLLCEDAAGDNVFGERLVGLTLDGKTFTFGINNINFLQSGFGTPPNPAILPRDYRNQEWAGACYSPDGQWLFVTRDGMSMPHSFIAMRADGLRKVPPESRCRTASSTPFHCIHFFNSAIQFCTTESGAFGSVSTIVLSRNRCPSWFTE
jgi:secreted PhoX family phosphatase